MIYSRKKCSSTLHTERMSEVSLNEAGPRSMGAQPETNQAKKIENKINGDGICMKI